jgi:hypothetical protein
LALLEILARLMEEAQAMAPAVRWGNKLRRGPIELKQP